MPSQKEKTLPSGRLTRSWTNQDPVDVLRVTVEHPDELLRQFDRHGRSLTTFALLQTAETAEKMAGQLAELVAPPEGEDRLARLVELLEAVAANQAVVMEGQLRTERQVAKLVAALDRIVANSSASSSRAPSTARQRQPASKA